MPSKPILLNVLVILLSARGVLISTPGRLLRSVVELSRSKTFPMAALAVLMAIAILHFATRDMISTSHDILMATLVVLVAVRSALNIAHRVQMSVRSSLEFIWPMLFSRLLIRLCVPGR